MEVNMQKLRIFVLALSAGAIFTLSLSPAALAGPLGTKLIADWTTEYANLKKFYPSAKFDLVVSEFKPLDAAWDLYMANKTDAKALADAHSKAQVMRELVRGYQAEFSTNASMTKNLLGKDAKDKAYAVLTRFENYCNVVINQK
jgi:hypothetical protein